jgi:hypothetical protein
VRVSDIFSYLDPGVLALRQELHDLRQKEERLAGASTAAPSGTGMRVHQRECYSVKLLT